MVPAGEDGNSVLHSRIADPVMRDVEGGETGSPEARSAMGVGHAERRGDLAPTTKREDPRCHGTKPAPWRSHRNV